MSWVKVKKFVKYAMYLVSIIFLGAGLISNPYILNIPQLLNLAPKASTLDLTWPTSFVFKSVDSGSDVVVNARCNVTSTDFVEYNPVRVFLDIDLPYAQMGYHKESLSIEAQPVNSVEYQQPSPAFPPLGNITLSNQTDNVHTLPEGVQAWRGVETVEFQAEGYLTLNLSIQAWNGTDAGSSGSALPEFTTTLTIPNVYIESRTVAELRQQQKTTESSNLSLTLFLLFFACLEIALTLSEHIERSQSPRPLPHVRLNL